MRCSGPIETPQPRLTVDCLTPPHKIYNRYQFTPSCHVRVQVNLEAALTRSVHLVILRPSLIVFCRQVHFLQLDERLSAELRQSRGPFFFFLQSTQISRIWDEASNNLQIDLYICRVSEIRKESSKFYWFSKFISLSVSYQFNNMPRHWCDIFLTNPFLRVESSQFLVAHFLVRPRLTVVRRHF